jgi:Sec-independent protein translocase protein TatA
VTVRLPTLRGLVLGSTVGSAQFAEEWSALCRLFAKAADAAATSAAQRRTVGGAMPAGLTSPVHLFVIVFVALIVLGPEKLPQALRQVGRTMGEVRRWSDAISSEMRGVLSLDAGDDPAGDRPTALTAPAVPAVPVGGQPGTYRQSSARPALQEGGEWH